MKHGRLPTTFRGDQPQGSRSRAATAASASRTSFNASFSRPCAPATSATKRSRAAARCTTSASTASTQTGIFFASSRSRCARCQCTAAADARRGRERPPPCAVRRRPRRPFVSSFVAGDVGCYRLFTRSDSGSSIGSGREGLAYELAVDGGDAQAHRHAHQFAPELASPIRPMKIRARPSTGARAPAAAGHCDRPARWRAALSTSGAAIASTGAGAKRRARSRRGGEIHVEQMRVHSAGDA